MYHRTLPQPKSLLMRRKKKQYKTDANLIYLTGSESSSAASIGFELNSLQKLERPVSVLVYSWEARQSAELESARKSKGEKGFQGSIAN